MLPLKKILYPTDFSELSFDALEAAKELAEQNSAELLIVHAVWQAAPMHPSATPKSLPEYEIEMRRSAEDALEKLAAEKIPEQIRARTFLLEGDPATEILEIAKAEGADLIVISSHGQTGWRRLVMGSVAEEVVRTASIPVLLIPAREHLAGLESKQGKEG